VAAFHPSRVTTARGQGRCASILRPFLAMSFSDVMSLPELFRYCLE
jgi:hypothetical protein